MGLRVNLATSGVVGVTGLTAGELSLANDGETLAINTVYALTGLEGFSVNLPTPGPGQDLSGSVIYFKNLMDDTGGGVTNRATFLSGALNVDGVAGFDPFTELRLQTFSVFYINDAIGWLVRM